MDRFLELLGIALLVALATASEDSAQDLSEPEYREWWQKWQKVISDFRHKPAFRKQLELAAKRDNHNDFESVTSIPFDCDVSLGKSPQVPDSVHKLRPGDISVVAALGDSITAGFGLGARILPEIILENRGESWSIGSNMELDHDVITMPNVIKEFNPLLKGSSICKRYPNHPMSWLNVAVSGATCMNMPGQINRLIEKIWEDPEIDMYKDWKLVTILIGGNDLCASCRNDNYLPANYRAKIQEALDILHEKAPRTLVNLVVMLDVGILRNFTEYEYCRDLQESVCSCVWSHPEQTSQYTIEYHDELKAMVDSGRYDKYHDFTVVLQTFLRDLVPLKDPETGQYQPGYFAPDCFHPSRRGHQEMGYLLWNNMLTPVGEKTFSYRPEDKEGYRCPTEENPYIFTNINSKKALPTEPPGPDEWNNTLKIGLICLAVVGGVILIIIGVLLVRRSRRKDKADADTIKFSGATSEKTNPSQQTSNGGYHTNNGFQKVDLSKQTSNGVQPSNGVQVGNGVQTQKVEVSKQTGSKVPTANDVPKKADEVVEISRL